MSTRKLNRAIQNLVNQVRKLAKALTKGLILWLFRNLLLLGRRPALSKAGFVLPTTVLLLLVVLLTVGSIGYRSFTRTTQTIGERQQRVIYNAATPTIDRAKAKLEYLFDAQRDPRFPSGVPAENVLLGMMLNKSGGTRIGTLTVPEHRPDGYDPYTFPDETRINIAGDGELDNAWRYLADTDADGTLDAVVVYSVIFSTPTDLANTSDASVQNVGGRADSLQVRHGPLSNNSQQNPNCAAATVGSAQPQQGWLPDATNSSILRKNFQVNAFVMPIQPINSPNEPIVEAANRPRASLEFHQDRQVDRGNKWGAWFRNDLEVFAGPTFNWNGAMHSEGSIIVGNATFNSFMISSPASCLYTKDASEVSVVTIPADPTNNVPAYQGQFIAGKLNVNQSIQNTDRGFFHIFTNAGQAPDQGNNTRLEPNTDSINPPDNPQIPSKYALDPVRLQTENNSVARGFTDPSTTRDDPAWSNRPLVQNNNGRLLTQRRQAPPYVDDSYRADDRYGPKPNYGRDDNRLGVPGSIGETIPTTQTVLVGNTPAAGEDNTSVGLDGYWERRARNEGLRVIVGQRLELGDAAGWGGPFSRDPNNEPLRPWSACTESGNNANRCNEARQRRSLYDNLPAVQATAIYHTASSTGNDFPLACLASTVHPGTAGTLDRSATFENLAWQFPANSIPGYTDANLPVISDFFRGRGTNGFEFQTPSLSTFSDTNSDLMKALRNLARFAGDPYGGSPSFVPVQDRFVHPFPAMAMWGDFSILRNILFTRDNPTPRAISYSTLSPADKSTLHTAGCTLGMLAYNLDYLAKFNPEVHPLIGTSYASTAAETTAKTAPGSTYYVGLRGAIRAIRDQISPLGRIPDLDTFLMNPSSTGTDAQNPDTYVRLLQRWRDNLPADGTTRGPNLPGTTISYNRTEMNQLILLAQMIIEKEQVARDRRYGFFGSGNTATFAGNAYSTGSLATQFANTSARGCQALFDGGIGDSLKYLCSNRPRFPVLYSIFPAPEVGAGTGQHTDADGGDQNVRDQLDLASTYINSRNAGVVYEAVDASQVALRPIVNRALWNLPSAVATAPTNNTPNNNRDNLIKVCLNGPCLADSLGTAGTGEFWQVGFKDSAFFNGREMMSVRAMDIHLNLLRNTPISTNYWLPQSGVVYAFREDAVSEVSIVRPTSGTWNTCGNDTALQNTATCQMQTGSVTADLSKDPPLNPNNNISVKPVDYYPDPDRRPNGFRLRRGERLDRPGDNGRGMSFVTDNPVYIQGSFNLHQDTGGTRLEEFNTLLADDFSNFYARNDLSSNFARANADLWRPSEILADAITIISDNFCDGSIQDSFLTASTGSAATLASASSPQVSLARYGCTVSTTRSNRSSYLTQNRPSTNPALVDSTRLPGVRWMRSNAADVIGYSTTSTAVTSPLAFTEGDSPIIVSKNGNPMVPNRSSPYFTGTYFDVTDAKPWTEGIDGTRVNSIIISGLVPSRPGQSYGGLHNFPRFLEAWREVGGTNARHDLFISGSLIQLSFSQQATGPFDQDAWEVGRPGDAANELIRYYDPPNRRWGYDVGLQYAPAGPIAQRFVSVPSIRSEFYSEPPTSDRYMTNLCRSVSPNCN